MDTDGTDGSALRSRPVNGLALDGQVFELMIRSLATSARAPRSSVEVCGWGGIAVGFSGRASDAIAAANCGRSALQSRKYLSIAAGPMLRVTPPRFPRIGPPALRIRGRRQQACGSICLVI